MFKRRLVSSLPFPFRYNLDYRHILQEQNSLARDKNKGQLKKGTSYYFRVCVNLKILARTT